MKLTLNQKSARRAFTLIEMIGVLAVIAILASLLIPKIFDAINQARISNAILGYNSMKTACLDHYAKFGSLLATTDSAIIGAGTSPSGATNGSPGMAFFDGLLLQEGLVDKTFSLKIGTGSYIEIVTNVIPIYDLNGDGTSETSSATILLEAVIQGVSATDAKDINDRLE